MDSGMQEACGVFGCVAAGTWPTQLEISNIICLGLIGLQHRGQESAGMTLSAGDSCHSYKTHKGMGLVSQVFTDHSTAQLKGNLGIGHNRYSTSGTSDVVNCQPFVVETIHGHIAVAHNGELVNAQKLKQKILRSGVALTTGTDSELITQVLALPPKGEEEPHGEPNWVARIQQLMECSQTSYSISIMYKDCIYAVRDCYGNRPLCLGKLMSSNIYTGTKQQTETNEECEGWVVSSESCSFQSIGAKYYREVLPGEIVKISRDGIESLCTVPRPSNSMPAFCIFEYVYFARPDSIFEGQMVYSVRLRCGKQLAIEAGVEADLVSTVPESATPAAIGYSQQLGIPYIEVLCKNRYIGRTFIQPSTRLRQLGVSKKFGALSENIKGKKIVLLDDSIVRGNTMGPIVRLVRSAGAKEVHVRIASPPLKYPCYMGINIPTKEELIANKMDLVHMANHLGADSVVYLSVDGLVKAVQSGIPDVPTDDVQNTPHTKTGHCTACLTGKYPVDLNW